MRRQEVSLARDWANLEQAMHSITHGLAINFRDLAQSYAEYNAFAQTRDAARENLEVQTAKYRSGLEGALFLNVLQAISDWGNAVSSQSQALAQYNSELANLERQTGTILETHGIRFFEERFGSLGPLGRLAAPVCYPLALPPEPNADRYPASDRPSEESFDLTPPVIPSRRTLQEQMNAPEPVPLPPP
jgi:hypothetical protein